MFFRSRITLLLSFLLAFVCASHSVAQLPAKLSSETISIRVSEGTELSFDISPDGRTIVFDLLGQLWLVPAKGGSARAVTDAVRDVAEDLDPSFSPDGHSVLFRGERNGRTGLWLLDLRSRTVRQLTQLSYPEGFDGNAAWSPNGRSIAFVRAIPPDATAGRAGRFALFLLDVATATAREVSISGITDLRPNDPVWIRDGKEIAFVARKSRGERNGRLWTVKGEGGQATPLTEETVAVRAPTFSVDGQKMAYLAPDGSGKLQVWVREIGIVAKQPVMLTNHADTTATRIRWLPKGNELLYSADGRLWKSASSGGKPTEIRFTAGLTITRPRRSLPQAHFPEPGRVEPARGFMGLAISPDGRNIGMLALGKLWLIPIAGAPRAVTSVPFDASTLAWSPDGTEMAWSAGVADNEDLYATEVATGSTRQVTSLPGREAYPAYSPDGLNIAFIHIRDDGVLRTVDARGGNVADIAMTRDLGSIGSNWTCTPQWSPGSDGLLVCGGTGAKELGRATFVPLAGKRETISRFPIAPIFLQWTPGKYIVYERHDRLWKATFDRTGLTADPAAVGSDAALYLSASRDGTLLYVSDGGLKLRSPDGTIKKIGWPLTYTPPVANSVLIRNARIIDGLGTPSTAARDILLEKGRIARIDSAGKIPAASAHVIDAENRFVIPGMIDLHAHVYRPDLIPGWPYFGVTTIRDQGTSIGPIASYAGNIASGALPGPRIAYGGFQYYSDWAFDEEQGRGIEPEADPEHIKRSVDLSDAFGAQHIKTRTFRRWDINARMIDEAHRRGMRATGHCSHLLPLIAAGMDAKEHIGFCEARGNTHMYDDMIQLFKAAGIGVVPTISYVDYAVRLSERPALLDADSELAPFIPSKDNFSWMFNMTAAVREDWTNDVRNAREGMAKLMRGGVTIGVGTDIWQIPTGVHMELEQLVVAGMPPAQAIRAATADAARILGAEEDLGSIEAGKRADLVILDADPLADIRNTRKIWNVIQDGHLIDRAAVIKRMKPR